MKRYSTWLILAGFLSLIFFMSWTYVFCSDDCFYGVMWDGTQWQRVGTIWNAFGIEIIDCHRPFIHFFARVFCGCYPKWVLNICNTAMMGILLLLINRLAVKSWRPDWKIMSVMCALVFLVLCKGESYLWGCGSINYLWTGVMTLAFCLLSERLENDNLSAVAAILLVIPVALIGSGNEAFSPPICFGLAAISLMNFKKLNWKKLLIYGAYGVAAIILCLIEAHRRSQNVPAPSVMTIIMSVTKVVYTSKCVWLLAIVFLFLPRKLEFLKRNVFELVVIGSSMIIGVAIGFVGERILWIANLMAIVLIVRECKFSRFWAFACLIVLCVVTSLLMPLGIRMRHNYDAFIAEYTSATDNVACLDYVDCGIMGRFFFQPTYQWQAMGYHPNAFSRFYGRPEVYPLGLTRQLYDKVYKSDAFRTEFVRLSLPFEAYEIAGGNTIVVPIVYGGQFDKPYNEVMVSYLPLASRWDKVKDFISSRGKPILPFPHFPVRLQTSWGECWLVARKPSTVSKVAGIKFKISDRKHPDDGQWWRAEFMKLETAPYWIERK